MQTPLQITFKNLAKSEWLEARIRERAERLERHHHGIVSCRVVVESPHKSPGSGKLPIGLTVEVDVPGRQLVSRAQEEPRETKGDSSRVITQAFEAMERQLEDVARLHRDRIRHASDDDLQTGRIARLFPSQGYGFVETGSTPDLYFTENALNGLKMDELEVGTMVLVKPAPDDGPMGPQAMQVTNIAAENRMRRT